MVLQTVERRYSRADNYRIFRLASRSPRYDETKSSYIFEEVTEIKLQLKADFFDPSNPVSFFGFLATFTLACNTNRSLERAPMCVLPFFD